MPSAASGRWRRRGPSERCRGRRLRRSGRCRQPWPDDTVGPAGGPSEVDPTDRAPGGSGRPDRIMPAGSRAPVRARVGSEEPAQVVERASGLRRGSPGPCRTRALADVRSVPASSTPSATTSSPRLWPRSMTDRTIVVVAGCEVGHEASVDLDLVDGKLAQVRRKRRVAGAEVVDAESDAELSHSMEHLERACRVVHQIVLAELEAQPRAGRTPSATGRRSPSRGVAGRTRFRPERFTSRLRRECATVPTSGRDLAPALAR